MSNVIGYCRVSSVGQSLNSSLAYQRDKIQSYCKLNDLQLHDILTEVDSGGNDERQVLGSIKSLIENHTIDTLIVFKLDRLSRSMLGSLKFIEVCRNNNVRVVSISDNIDTGDKGKSDLILNILLSIATEERRMILVRCNSGREMKWKHNQIPYSKVPFGYKRNKKGEVVVDRTNSMIVQYIYKKWNLLCKMKHLTKSKRTIRLLKLLKRNNHTFNGKEFRWWNLRDILKNSFYCGYITWKEEVKESSYPPIVSRRLFNQIQPSVGN